MSLICLAHQLICRHQFSISAAHFCLPVPCYQAGRKHTTYIDPCAFLGPTPKVISNQQLIAPQWTVISILLREGLSWRRMFRLTKGRVETHTMLPFLTAPSTALNWDFTASCTGAQNLPLLQWLPPLPGARRDSHPSPPGSYIAL